MKFLFTGVMLLFSSEKLPAQSGVATQQIQISVPGNISIDNFIELSSGEKGSSENGRKYFNVKSNQLRCHRSMYCRRRSDIFF